MAQIELKNITISLSGKQILNEVDLKINDNEKVGIVGKNGSGKTTLLNFLLGNIEKDYNEDGSLGEYNKNKNVEFGYLSQIVKDDNKTAYEFLLEAYKKNIDINKEIENLTNQLENEYDEKIANKLNQKIDIFTNNEGLYFEKELKKGFVKFGFDIKDIEKKLSEFSGGQVTKISILKLLLSKPEILLLDEPTNHLDIDGIEWMEEYLKKYEKNIIIVSHDRMFLDNICDVIVDIDNKKLVRYEGNYTDFIEQKKLNRELLLAEYSKNQKEIERLTKTIERFRYKATKARMVKSKDKIIEKLKKAQIKPEKEDNKTFDYIIKPNKEGGREVLNCENLEFGYKNDNETKKIGVANFLVYKGDRIAIVGKNGSGKSTLLKTLVGKIEKISGKLSFGFQIEYEYFDQNVAENKSEDTVYEDFSKNFPMLNNEEIRNRLGRFLFVGEDVEKIVKNLSGGEKVRLTFAKLFEKKPNLLILDEPTNHLDLQSKETLEKIIKNYKGTVIFVSHDRYFVKQIATKVLYFDDNSILFFEYGYEDYDKYIKKKKGIEEDILKEITYKVRKENQKLINEYNSAKEANNYKKVLNSMMLDMEEDEIKKISNEEKYILEKQKKKDEKRAVKIEEKVLKLEEEIKLLEEEYGKEENQTDFQKLCEINLSIMEKKEEIEKLIEEL